MNDEVHSYIKELEIIIRDLESELEEARDEVHMLQDKQNLLENALRDAQRLNAMLDEKLSHYYL
jgi:phage shock protein A